MKRRVEADRRLLAFLVHAKKLDAAKGSEIERLAADEDLSIIQALAARGVLGEDEVAKAIAAGLRIPLLALDSAPFDEQVEAYVKDEMAVKCAVVPVRKEGEALVIAMANPFDQEVIRAIEFSSGRRVRPGVATRSGVLEAIEQRYKPDKALRTLLRDIPETGSLELVRFDNAQVDLRALADEAEGAPVVKIVNLCLGDALACGASDIHIEPGPNLVQVRYRINGVLEDVLEVPKWAQASVVARVKIIAKLDITERRVPQDGHLRVRYADKLIDLRVSSLPTAHGEKIVIRVLNPENGLRDLDAIGLSDRDLGVLREMIQAPEGMILVTGPTGSGKSSTLYTALNWVKSPTKNIITVEDPIEYQLEGVNQVQINVKAGVTFAAGLRSILRQDPNVILVGEIRDHETAGIALEAAQTGHLLLSTVHTNDAPSTISRLLDLGGLASTQCSKVNQIRSYAEGESSGRDVFRGIGDANASGGNEFHFWKWRSQRAQVIWATHAATRKHFDYGSAFGGRVHEFGRSEGTGNGELAASLGGAKDRDGQPWAHQELCAGVQASRSIVFGQNCSCADQYRIAVMLGYAPNHVRGIRHGHCYFYNRNASGTDRAYGSAGLVGGTRSHHGDDANFADFSNCFFNRHGLFGVSASARDSSGFRFHCLQYFGQGCHARITRCGHGESSMGSAAFDSPLRAIAREKSVNEPGGKRIAASDAVVNLEILPHLGLEKLTVAKAHRAPVVHGRGPGVPQRGSQYPQIWEFFNGPFHHALEVGGIEIREVFIEAIYRQAQGGREIFFVTEHHIDEWCKLTINFLGFGFAADRLPQGRPVVKVIGNDGASTFGGRHGLHCDQRCGLREGTIDAARVKPPRAFRHEDAVPIDVSGLELGDCGMAAIGTT